MSIIERTARFQGRLLPRHIPRFGLTLTELILVLVIIAVLAGLFVSAIQRIRESANRAQCQNNLKQIGLALHAHHDAYGRFPTGGWGWSWVGMPDRGPGPDQPGGWIYNILPFIEQDALRKLGTGQVSPQVEESILTLLASPIPAFNCPTRRDGGPYPTDGRPLLVGVSDGRTSAIYPDLLARTDYAGNAGSQKFHQWAGPPSLANGDSAGYRWPDSEVLNGIFFLGSTVTLLDISRGTSNTFMAGERYIDPAHYYDGQDLGDNETMYAGFDNDVLRSTFKPPRRDRSGNPRISIFGSAHSAGLNMLYCDGSVRTLGYDVHPDLFLQAGCRFN